MNNFTFYSPTEFVFGRKTEDKTGKLCKEYNANKVLIVYGGNSAIKSGLLEKIRTSLTSEHISFFELGGVEPNPTDRYVYDGIKIVRENNIDFILAVGGGSVIDTAKAIAAGAKYNSDFWDFFISKAVINKAIKIGVVLTIPAAGSEGSGNCVITKTSTLQKLSVRTDKVLRPVFAIMNPELTFSLPAQQTAYGISDMMAHIMERYFTNTEDVEITDRLCEGTLKAIIEETPKVFTSPDNYGARANLMWSGMISHNGTCGVGREEDWVSHYMEHEVSALYNVPHGAGLSVIFIAWLRWMVNHNPKKIVQFAVRVWNVDNINSDVEIAKEGVERLKDFWQSIGLPVTFEQLGVSNPDIDLLVSQLHKNKGEKIGCYQKLTPKETREIFELAL